MTLPRASDAAAAVRYKTQRPAVLSSSLNIFELSVVHLWNFGSERGLRNFTRKVLSETQRYIKTNRVVQVLPCGLHTCVWADKQWLLLHRSVGGYGIVIPLLFLAVWLGGHLEGCQRRWECHIELDRKEI
jgi:hypothetical protein